MISSSFVSLVDHVIPFLSSEEIASINFVILACDIAAPLKIIFNEELLLRMILKFQAKVSSRACSSVISPFFTLSI
ncbi:hypothetical protein [Candidatus Rickettsia kedanie]|uniref:Uncharacterized protein n=1 Tax=Candidatus Rickettsia kedanie TaxID=3115352 RepID=A0ABP9TVU0_9RICK